MKSFEKIIKDLFVLPQLSNRKLNVLYGQFTHAKTIPKLGAKRTIIAKIYALWLKDLLVENIMQNMLFIYKQAYGTEPSRDEYRDMQDLIVRIVARHFRKQFELPKELVIDSTFERKKETPQYDAELQRLLKENTEDALDLEYLKSKHSIDR